MGKGCHWYRHRLETLYPQKTRIHSGDWKGNTATRFAEKLCQFPIMTKVEPLNSFKKMEIRWLQIYNNKEYMKDLFASRTDLYLVFVEYQFQFLLNYNKSRTIVFILNFQIRWL